MNGNTGLEILKRQPQGRKKNQPSKLGAYLVYIYQNHHCSYLHFFCIFRTITIKSRLPCGNHQLTNELQEFISVAVNMLKAETHRTFTNYTCTKCSFFDSIKWETQSCKNTWRSKSAIPIWRPTKVQRTKQHQVLRLLHYYMLQCSSNLIIYWQIFRTRSLFLLD